MIVVSSRRAVGIVTRSARKADPANALGGEKLTLISPAQFEQNLPSISTFYSAMHRIQFLAESLSFVRSSACYGTKFSVQDTRPSANGRISESSLKIPVPAQLLTGQLYVPLTPVSVFLLRILPHLRAGSSWK